jgi:hypothetical protein
MAVTNPVSSLRAGLTALAVLVAADVAVAQQQPPENDPNNVKDSDCTKIPGGNAPVDRIARIEGSMSVQNLEMTYFEKPLHGLSDDDLEYLAELWPQCGTFEDEIAKVVADRLTKLINDARTTRQASLDWINEVEAELNALPPGEESIRVVHDLWQQMLNKEFEMLPTDLKYLAGKITEKRDELYRVQEQRRRTLINPFDPGAPVTRDLGGRS